MGVQKEISPEILDLREIKIFPQVCRARKNFKKKKNGDLVDELSRTERATEGEVTNTESRG